MRKLMIATALLAATALTGTANASVNISSIAGDPGYLTGNLSYTPGSIVLNGLSIGRFQMNGTTVPGGDPVSYLTYCIDIFHTVHSGLFEIQPLSTLVTDSLRQQQLLALISNTDPLLNSALSLAERQKISAATQLAVWEIAFEGSGTYSLTGGDLKVSGGTTAAAARALADEYLGKVVSTEWTPVAGQQLELLYSKTNQSQVFLSAAVPEPATWAMLIAGFGLVGAATRRRRTTVSYA